MEGAALRRKAELDVATFTAWHTARFALNGWANKGRLAGHKTLADLIGGGSRPVQSLQNARGIAFFHRLKAQGVPVKITRH